MFEPTRQIGNTVLPKLPPQPNMPQFPSFNLASETLPAHNATMNAIVPVGPRPSGDFMPSMPKVVVPDAKIGAENFIPTLAFNRSVQESFGGDPRFEAEQMAYRPTNPRTLGQAPQVKITPTAKQVPVFDKTVIPKANRPNMPNYNAMIGPTSQVFLEAKPVAPPVRNADLGGLLSSTSSIVGNIGTTPGRAFGAESFLIHKF
jgi:hypothetical protein|tara:strand:+ start:4527 stop:5135 length:609 start_codon:yes stop_codon:yes gene_type:complete